MRLVIGAFTTLSEAEEAVRALLETGHDQQAITAHGRSGGGRLLLAARVAVHPVGDPARLVSRAERARAWAAAGAVIGLVLAAVALGAGSFVGVDVAAPLRTALGSWYSNLAVLLLGTLVGGAVAALARRTDGLPHDLAFRYGVRLDQGDTVVSVRTAPGDQTRAAQELLGIHGAVFAHVTRGAVEPLGLPPPGVTNAPGRN